MARATCAVNVVFTIKPEHVDSFRQAVTLQAKNSVTKEPWCHQFDVGETPDKPNCFLLYETYDDRDAFVKHRETPHFAQFIETVQGWIEAKEISVWDILPTLP